MDKYNCRERNCPKFNTLTACNKCVGCNYEKDVSNNLLCAKCNSSKLFGNCQYLIQISSGKE